MELSKMSNQERLKLCRRYFYLGFLALPFLWIVNTVWFGLFLFNYDSYKQQRRQQRSNNRINRQTDTSQQQPHQLRNTNQQPEVPNTASPSTPSRQSTNTETQSPSSPSDRQSTMDEETKNHLRSIRSLVLYSFIGSFIWIVSLTSWIIIYQIKRAEWGEWGDEISFNIPRGIP